MLCFPVCICSELGVCERLRDSLLCAVHSWLQRPAVALALFQLTIGNPLEK